MSDATALSNGLAVFAATYLLHSTLLLSVCWMLLKVSRTSSHFLTERMWKSAAVLGLATALLQIAIGASPETKPKQVANKAVTQIASGGPRLPRTQSSVLGTGDVSEVSNDAVDAALLASVEPHDGGQVSSMEFIDEHSHLAPLDETYRVELETLIEPAAPVGVSPAKAQFTERDGYVVDEPYETGLTSSGVAGITIEPSWWDALRVFSPWLISSVSVVLGGCVIAGGALLAFQSLRLRTRFATARLLKDGPARRTLDRFLKRNKIRRHVRLLVSTEHTEPVTYGLLAWTIVLPASTEDQLGRDELRALLAHEVAHLVRGDVWWLCIGRVLCTCLAFQPLNWLARRKWGEAAEYLCDDWAVERGVRSISLARCLTQIAEWRFGQQACEVGLAAGGTKATLVQRVERLVEDDRRADVWARPLRRRMLTMGAAVAMVGLAGFAPRVALPLAVVSERNGVDFAAGLAVDEDTTHDWHALEEELLQLEADVDRVNKLLRAQLHDSRGPLTPTLSLAAAQGQENLNRRAAALRARREHIASLLGKDSER